MKYKNYIRHVSYLRNSIAYDHDFWWHLQVFFSFFQNYQFAVASGVKEQKTTKTERKLFQEPYFIWLSFMIQLCKMIISPGVFFIFPKFRFSGLLGDTRAKISAKLQKCLPIHSISQEPYMIWLSFMVTFVK